MAYSDRRGLPISTTSSEALAAYERGLDLFLRWRSGALAALAWAYGQTGQTSRQQHICQQLVNRAEEVRLHPEAPELCEARQALQAMA